MLSVLCSCDKNADFNTLDKIKVDLEVKDPRPSVDIGEIVESYVFDCTFVEDDDPNDGFISDFENLTMSECYNSRFTEKSDIEENLIGEWELIGVGSFWNPYFTMPCQHLEITENEIINTLYTATFDTTLFYNWEITEIDHPNGNYFTLTTEPFGIYINSFCSDYMFQNAVPIDGGMTLYQKMN